MLRVLTIAITIAACGDPPPPAKPTPHPLPPAPVDAAPAVPPAPPRLVTEDEIKKYEADVQQRLAAHQKRTCPRKVLRGAPAAGAAATEMLAFEHPTGALAACALRLADLDRDQQMVKAIETRRSDVLSFDKECGAELEAVVRRTVAHEDGCSAFRIGVLVEPTDFVRYLRMARLVGLRARLIGERDPKAGAWLALELARFGQDFGRFSGMLNLAIGDVITEMAVETARVILERKKLAAADLAELGGAIATLIETHIPFAPAMQSELDHFLLYLAYAPLQPERWVPPGGWPDGKRPEKAKGTVAFSHHPRDEAAVFFVLIETVEPKLRDACPANASLRDCHAGLAKLSIASPLQGGVKHRYEDMVKSAALGHIDAKQIDELRLKIRADLIDILAEGMHSAYVSHATRHGETLARVTALAVHVDVLAQLAKTRRCPPMAALVATYGERVTLATEKGGIRVAPPKWASNRPPEYKLTCP